MHAMNSAWRFKNAPVCLQLVGRTLEEEAVIKMTEIVGAALESAKLA
jgi:Asp-tRNA(Asn)/Glu-tRNA(Gln) amidotransferase A subunit family amidase